MTSRMRRIPSVFSLAIWFVVWELVGRSGASSIVPPLSAVIAAGSDVVPTPKFATAAAISLRSFALGMAFALLVGIPLGILMGRVKAAARILVTWVNVFVSAPISELVPLLMAIIGIGESTVVVTVFLFAVFVIVVFLFAFAVSEAIAALERRVEYYAAAR